MDNPAEDRFEATIDGHRALLAYERDGPRLVLVHTEVPEELEGRGVGGRLVEAAADAAVVGHLTLVPTCPFAREWLRRHPEAADRLTISWPEG